jgi:ketosteroid isomerase-like protein
VDVEERTIIERSIDAGNRGDMETVLELTSPEIEIDDRDRSGTHRGHEGLLAFAREWLENFDQFWIEIREMEEGPNGVFVALTQRGKGKESGIEFALPLHYAMRLRDGKVAYWGITTTAKDARVEVGLN